MSTSSSGAVAKHAEKLVRVYHSKLAQGSFAALLGSSASKIVALTRQGASFQFVLNERLTLKKQLSVSTALAIFDDLSTIGFMGADQGCRPGVSVSLQTELLRAVPAGTDLTLHCKIDKLGKTIGFTSMELALTGDRSVVVARGSHVKYLPLGNWLLDSVILQPAVLAPLLTHGLYEDGSTIFTRLGLAKPFAANIAFDNTVGVFDALGLSPVPGAASPTMQATVHQALCNPMRSFHGGAVAMAAELTAATLARPSGLDAAAVATEMQLTYLSALPHGQVLVEASPDAHGQPASHGVLRRGGGKGSGSAAPAVKFSVRFGTVAPL